MKNLTPVRTATAILSLLGSALFLGCNAQPKGHGETFYTDNQETCVGSIAKAQCSAGAKEDATLHDVNFHGAALNSLGEVKLDLIVKGTTAGYPVYVYMDMPHDQVAARQPAVTAYLKAAGLTDTKIIVAEGPNPNPSTPTAYNMGGLYKQDGSSYSGQAAADSGSSAGAESMSTGSSGH